MSQQLISCSSDEIVHSLLTTKNESLFHHSFDLPPCAEGRPIPEYSVPECLIMFLNIV